MEGESTDHPPPHLLSLLFSCPDIIVPSRSMVQSCRNMSHRRLDHPEAIDATCHVMIRRRMIAQRATFGLSLPSTA